MISHGMVLEKIMINAELALLTFFAEQPQPCYSSFSLGLGNLPVVSKSEAMAAIKKYLSSLTKRFIHMKSRWEQQKPLPYFVDTLFDHSATVMKAELEWINKFIRQLEAAHEQD